MSQQWFTGGEAANGGKIHIPLFHRPTMQAPSRSALSVAEAFLARNALNSGTF